MRFGWLAAAAAVVCAGQADAARYYEFQIEGLTMQPYDFPTLYKPIMFTVLHNIVVSFDSLDPFFDGLRAVGTGPYSPGYWVMYSPNAGSMYTMNMPGGSAFSIGFNPADLAVSDTLQEMTPTRGSLGYLLCQRYCGMYQSGTLTSFKGRTSDIAPAALGITDRTGLYDFGVPEPATWTMMILGVAAIGAVARRRVRVAFA